jgi:ABC-2 type transport system permease protein
MEQILMAPVSTASYVVGKTLPYLFLSFVSALGILVASMLLFDMPVRGSWVLLLGTTALFLVGALGQGLFISTIAESQQVAFQAALLSSFLPTLILSGFVFPIASMPIGIQYVAYIVPARYYLVALRGVVLKGVGLVDVLPQLGALAVFALVMLSLSAVRLTKGRA